MTTATQTELKQLLTNQLSLAHTKVITALIGATLAATITPLKAWDIPQIKAKYESEIINLISFISGLGCCGYAFIASGKVREYSGKLKMFSELEKQTFIEEQLLAQQYYLSQLRYQYEQPSYQAQLPESSSPVIDIVPAHTQPTHSPHTTEKTSIDTAHTQPTHSPHTAHTQEISTLSCPECGSIDIKKNGKHRDKTQRWECKDCGTDW